MGIMDSWGMEELEKDNQNKTYDPVPKGEYVCSLHDVSLGDINGTPTVNLTWRIHSGEHKTRQFWQTIWCSEPKTDGQKISFRISTQALGAYDLAKKAETYNEMAENILTAAAPKVDKLFKVDVWGYRTTKDEKTYEQVSVKAPFTESEIHEGVENKAPQFDDKEELPF